jgi:hypothetical protein
MWNGIGIGIGRQRFASGIFSAYAARVAADGGVTEAGACVDAVSALLQTASLLLVPSGYKSGKVYSQIPTNGNGDLTFTRASTAVRTNSTGLLESMATGVPRLSYMYGSCPALLLEPQRTNLALRSEEFDNASWIKTNSTITPNNTTAPDGNLTADRLSDNSTSGIHGVQAVNIGSSGIFTFSFYAKANTLNRVGIFTNSVVNVNLATTPLVFDLLNGVVVNSVTGITASIESRPNGWYRCSAVIPTSASGNYLIVTSNGGTTVNYIGSGQSIFIWGAQVEAGAYSTTYIPTTTAAVTRIADVFTRDNIYTNNLITSSGGTWFMEFRNNIAYVRDTAQSVGVGENVTLTGNSLFLRIDNTVSARYTIMKRVSGVANSLYTTITNTVKVAIKWNGTTADVFVNGTKVVSATAFTTTNMEHLIGTVGVPLFIQQMALYPSPLSDDDLEFLTGDSYNSYSEMATALNYTVI